MPEQIITIYQGLPEEFSWAGFGSGSGTNLLHCAQNVSPPDLLVSDKPKAKFLKLPEFVTIEKIVENGFKECGSFKKAREEDNIQEYMERSRAFNELLYKQVKAFEDKREKPIDLIVLGGYMRFVMDPFLTEYKDRIINVHPGDLTVLTKNNKRLYIGDDAVTTALHCGETKTKSSVILCDVGEDHGEILTRGPSFNVSPYYGLIEDQGTKKIFTKSYVDGYHQEKQKEASDWPALAKALQLIKDGRLALGTEKTHFGEWRTVYLDNKPLEYGGFDVPSSPQQNPKTS